MSLSLWPGRRKAVVIHYTGHRILHSRAKSRFPVRREAEVARIIARIIKRERVMAGYGGLASGSDILIAEALLASGAQLHVILPCDEEGFVRSSVAEAGEVWIGRFRALIEASTSLEITGSKGAAVNDYGGAADRALDMAETLARATGRDTLQVALFDGDFGEGDAGTGPDIKRGQERGWRQIVVRLRKRGRIREVA